MTMRPRRTPPLGVTDRGRGVLAAPRRALVVGMGATLFAVFWLAVVPRAAATAPTALPLRIKVIFAHNQSTAVDPSLQGLAQDLRALPFTGYALKDEAQFTLELLAVGRMQLPGGAWMTVRPLALEPDGRLRLELEVKKLKFKTVAAIAAGATLALGGPNFEKGVLILAVTRPPASEPTAPVTAPPTATSGSR